MPRYVSFLAETRSSTSSTSTLSDFALGTVNSIGTTYKVKAGQYSNTVTATGVDQATNVKVSTTDSNYHFGVAAGPQLGGIRRPSAPVGVTSLTRDQLAPIVTEAVARWSVITGLPVDVLSQIPVEIADLPDGGNGRAPILGYTSDAVQIDVNARGFEAGSSTRPCPTTPSSLANSTSAR